MSYGIFHQGIVCLCAVSAKTTSPSCSCASGAEQESGSSMCSRTYFQGAFSVSLGRQLGPTRPTSSLANVDFSFDGQGSSSAVWDLGDGSDEMSKTTGSGDFSYNYLMAGEYNVSLQLQDVTLQWPQSVLDPIGAARVVAPSYSDAQKDLNIRLELGRGSKVNVRWRRFNANGNQILGELLDFLSELFILHYRKLKLLQILI